MGILPNNHPNVNTPRTCRDLPLEARQKCKGLTLKDVKLQKGMRRIEGEDDMGWDYNPSFDSSSSSFLWLWVRALGVFRMTLTNPSPRPLPLKWGNP